MGARLLSNASGALLLVATLMLGSLGCIGVVDGSKATATVVAGATSIELTLLALQARTPAGTPTVLAARTSTPTVPATPAAAPTVPATPAAASTAPPVATAPSVSSP